MKILDRLKDRQAAVAARLSELNRPVPPVIDEAALSRLTAEAKVAELTGTKGALGRAEKAVEAARTEAERVEGEATRRERERAELEAEAAALELAMEVEIAARVQRRKAHARERFDRLAATYGEHIQAAHDLLSKLVSAGDGFADGHTFLAHARTFKAPLFAPLGIEEQGRVFHLPVLQAPDTLAGDAEMRQEIEAVE